MLFQLIRFSRLFKLSLLFKIVTVLIGSNLLILNDVTGNIIPEVVYGKDGRKDYYQIYNGALRRAANATAAMVKNYQMMPYYNDQSKAECKSFEKQFNLCPSVKFASQPTAARCSGFIVSQKYLITAGHCVRSQFECEEVSWVFDYKLKAPNGNPAVFKNENIYGCKKLVASILNPLKRIDLAIIELDRAVTDREPLQFRRYGQITTNQSVMVIGYPSGLPMKITQGGFVRKNNHPTVFQANLDAFTGNSGSPVLNADTLKVEGILVNGEEDFIKDPVAGCNKTKFCTMSGCKGESVTRITIISKAIDKLMSKYN